MNAKSRGGTPLLSWAARGGSGRYGWDICMGLLLISRSPTLLLCPMGGLRKTLQRPFTAHRVSVFVSHSITQGNKKDMKNSYFKFQRLLPTLRLPGRSLNSSRISNSYFLFQIRFCEEYISEKPWK